MRVGGYMAIVVLLCSTGGLALALGLSGAYADLERDVELFGSQSALLRDIARLEEDLSQWTVTSDLVYGSGDTYLIDGALRRIDSLRTTISRISSDSLAKPYSTTLEAVDQLVSSNEIRLRSALEISADRRSTVLPELLLEWDQQSELVFTQLLQDREQADSEMSRLATSTNEWRQMLMYISVLSVFAYLLVVAITWRWAVVKTSKPLLRLATDAKSSLREGTPFHPLPAGPREMRELSISLEAFAGNLEEIVAERTRQQAELLQELDHRVKNNLATILSMIDETARETDDIRSFQESFSGRIVSMARAHELLAASKWSGIDLREAIQIMVEASGGTDCLSLDGEPVLLSVNTATPTALVLNELATNARKHGSLSNGNGQVHINWKLDGDCLRLSWQERGGPTAQLPFAEGMGTRLIKGFIVYQLHGEVVFDSEDGDYICRLVIPLAQDDSIS